MKRFHRSNLALMGVLPLQFKEGETAKEEYQILIFEDIKPRQLVKVTAADEDGTQKTFEAAVRFDSEVEIDYYRHGGVLQMVLRNKLALSQKEERQR